MGNETYYLFIKPEDPVFFRMGKPNTMGQDSWTNSQPFPNPSVIWGAIFSRMVVRSGLKFSSDEFKSIEENLSNYLNIKRIYIHNQDDSSTFLPAPLDIFVDEDEKFHPPVFEKCPEFSSCKYDYLALPPKEGKLKQVNNYLIEVNSLGQFYFDNSASMLNLIKTTDIYKISPKTGIKHDYKTKTAQDGHLYRLDKTKFKPGWGFLVELKTPKKIENISFKENLGRKGFLKLGGKSTAAKYEIFDGFDNPLLRTNRFYDKLGLEENKDGRIILTTPTSVGVLNNLNCNIKAANVGKTLRIGGFDVKTKNPKIMKEFFPAGSVFYLENLKIKDSNFDFDCFTNTDSKENQNQTFRGFNQGIFLPY